MDEKNPIYFLEWFDLSDVTIVENKCYNKLKVNPEIQK